MYRSPAMNQMISFENIRHTITKGNERASIAPIDFS